ncbi:hypothetical protein FB192DRAFT_1358674 [Mucor lusitanicus]|uniref:Uncharacterized protein n=1 Tax=Mucor circinelloides f. lusitanicus TaxID=29924 RepID=A0A8H4BLZ3_MUCCL|nr:hypothetical protein FB192DRAFT_1358674 [Mucor lusitanicus]
MPLQPPVPKTTPFKFFTVSLLQYIVVCVWSVFGLYIPLLWLPWITFIQPFYYFLSLCSIAIYSFTPFFCCTQLSFCCCIIVLWCIF